MWDIVKSDATTKSTLYLLDVEDELASMKLGDTKDPKTHLSELKEHFQLMIQCRNNLVEMGSVLSDSRYRTIIIFVTGVLSPGTPDHYCGRASWCHIRSSEYQ